MTEEWRVVSGFTDYEVSDLGRIRSDPRKQKEIANSFGISQSLVSVIKRRKCWAHIE